MIYNLKCWPEYFRPIMSGQMTACLRVNDRNYQIGDVLRLHEYEPGGFVRPQGDIPLGYTGDVGLVLVTHVVVGGPHVPEGMALLSLKVIEEEDVNG